MLTKEHFPSPLHHMAVAQHSFVQMEIIGFAAIINI